MWQKLLGYLGVYLIERIIKMIKEAIAEHQRKAEQKKQDQRDLDEINKNPNAVDRARLMQSKIQNIRNRQRNR
jgi:hypothetical protein